MPRNAEESVTRWQSRRTDADCYGFTIIIKYFPWILMELAAKEGEVASYGSKFDA
jgi:hypothetical protein